MNAYRYASLLFYTVTPDGETYYGEHFVSLNNVISYEETNGLLYVKMTGNFDNLVRCVALPITKQQFASVIMSSQLRASFPIAYSVWKKWKSITYEQYQENLVRRQ